MAILISIGIGSSAAVGVTDEGQINVQQAIEDRNERIRTNTQDERDVLTSTVEVPVQNSIRSKPQGGLWGRSPDDPARQEVVTPEPDTGTSTASTTEATASSTDEVIENEEGGQEETGEGEIAGVETDASQEAAEPEESTEPAPEEGVVEEEAVEEVPTETI